MTTSQLRPLNAWPDAEQVVVAWLKLQLTDVNVVTETDTTFATSAPKPGMAVPLIRVTRVTGGNFDLASVTEEALLDVECFGANRVGAWGLYRYSHAAMLQLTGQRTAAGGVDEVDVNNGAGEVNYQNPAVRRIVTTYRLAIRAQATV